MTIDHFRFTVAEEDYVRAVTRVHSVSVGDGGWLSRIELWLVRFLVAIAIAAGAVGLWMLTGAPLLTALGVAGAITVYVLLERLVLLGLSASERALDGIGDRMIARQLRGTTVPEALIGRVTVQFGSGSILLCSESGVEEQLKREDIDRVVRDEGMTVIVRRNAGKWHQMVVPVPDAGLDDGLDPMLVFEALQRSLSAGQP